MLLCFKEKKKERKKERKERCVIGTWLEAFGLLRVESE